MTLWLLPVVNTGSLNYKNRSVERFFFAMMFYTELLEADSAKNT